MEINIGANIKRLRTAKNITQEQLSIQMNVTCAAVSKWERDETYPDITLLQPLAYYFGVSLDELMGYDQQKTQAEIEEAIVLYRRCRHSDYNKANEIITKAYRKYPNNYWVMHYYMWNISGGLADNESAGKKKSSRIRKGNLFLKSTLVECAHSAIRHKDSSFYAKYCKIAARRGGKRTIVAIAHSMALAIYHILLNREHFYDLGSDYFNTIYAEKIKKRNIQSLEKLGFSVSLS